jgi:hypothetical protein
VGRTNGCDYFPRFPQVDSVLDRYLTTIAKLKAAVEIPVIASLTTPPAAARG